MIKNKRPVVAPHGRRCFHANKSSDVYAKGAWILHSLRNTIENDSLFFSIIKNFYNDNKLSVITSQDFIDLVNKETNQDFTWFFSQYLNHNKVPVLEYYFSDDGILYYCWRDVNNDFKNLPVFIKISSNEEIIKIYPSKDISMVSIPVIDTKKKDLSYHILDFRALFGKTKNKKLQERYMLNKN